MYKDKEIFGVVICLFGGMRELLFHTQRHYQKPCSCYGGLHPAVSNSVEAHSKTDATIKREITPSGELNKCGVMFSLRTEVQPHEDLNAG